MQKALFFLIAVAIIFILAFAKPVEGFTTLMGINWTEMNEGTPAALYSKLPIKQPKVVDLAETGIGNVQPSPPGPGTLPSAPAPERSKETPNPYREPSLEPAKYIRILGVKEDLQAFFGFQAFMLEQRGDPAIQIPLTRARADMNDLINVQSVMERNPGLPSRINNKQLDDIKSNLLYLRDILHDLESSGAIQSQAIEGFTNMDESPMKIYLRDYWKPINEILKKKIDKNEINLSPRESGDLMNSAIGVSILFGAIVDNNPNFAVQVSEANETEKEHAINRNVEIINHILESQKITPSVFAPLIPFSRKPTIQDIKNIIQTDLRTRGSQTTSSGQITQTTPSQTTPSQTTPSQTTPSQITPAQITPTQTNPPQMSSVSSEGRRATLKEIQDFQVKVVVEITRLGASGTSDPVIQGRLNTLNRIKDEVDQVIEQLQSGTITPETTPIYTEDIEKALPLLGKPNDPLPQVLKQSGLPPAVANLFPGGLSPKDTEQAQQINNIVKGYMNNLFEGASWGVNLNFKYDNPNIAKLQAEAAKSCKNSGERSYSIETGLPGVQGSAQLAGYDGEESKMAPSNGPMYDRTSTAYDSGLPGISVSRTLPEIQTTGIDWKQRSQQIKEQIRRRGMNPSDFGALPDDVIVSKDFSWRGHTQMMCMRLNATTDPGLATTVGCPPQSWQGWRE